MRATDWSLSDVVPARVAGVSERQGHRLLAKFRADPAGASEGNG